MENRRKLAATRSGLLRAKYSESVLEKVRVCKTLQCIESAKAKVAPKARARIAPKAKPKPSPKARAAPKAKAASKARVAKPSPKSKVKK